MIYRYALGLESLCEPPPYDTNDIADLPALLYKISFIKVDLPEPLTPVTTVNSPIGNFTLIFCRLFSLAPRFRCGFYQVYVVRQEEL